MKTEISVSSLKFPIEDKARNLSIVARRGEERRGMKWRGLEKRGGGEGRKSEDYCPVVRRGCRVKFLRLVLLR